MDKAESVLVVASVCSAVTGAVIKCAAITADDPSVLFVLGNLLIAAGLFGLLAVSGLCKRVRTGRTTRGSENNYITSDPAVLCGRPVIRGTRLAVSFIVGLLDQGCTEGDILDFYPGITADDVRACTRYAHEHQE